MQFSKGDRVSHPQKVKEWGVGQVLEDCSGDKVWVYFEVGGEKTLSLDHAKLTKVPKVDNLILDNLASELQDSGKNNGRKTYEGLGYHVSNFIKYFPDGFDGEKYLEEERNYKMEAHQLMAELLDSDTFDSLLDDQEYQEICDRARKVINKTNLIFPNEKMALVDGLKSPSNQKQFSERLNELLYGKGNLEARFIDFAKCLQEMDADKWTTQTYFLFITDPKKFMFMKPEVTKQAAKACGFELNYKPELNWLTYNQLLKLSNYLMEKLSDLKPRDMIDIQSFIWRSGEAVK